MALILVLALQAAAPARALPATPRWAMIAPPAGAAGVPDDFDLASYAPRPDPRCLGAGGGEEVVVCGRRGGTGTYPLARMTALYAPAPIRAEMDLGGNVQGNVHLESAPGDRGAVANRVMVGIRWPF